MWLSYRIRKIVKWLTPNERKRAFARYLQRLEIKRTKSGFRLEPYHPYRFTAAQQAEITWRRAQKRHGIAFTYCIEEKILFQERVWGKHIAKVKSEPSTLPFIGDAFWEICLN